MGFAPAPLSLARQPRQATTIRVAAESATLNLPMLLDAPIAMLAVASAIL
jgi:hypothetical protein